MKIGTPLASNAFKVLLCGSGELGKEVVIELQRFGVETVCLDRYPNAPAMHVAHKNYTVSMLDGKALREIIEKEKPDLIVPEIEAIATDTLAALEEEGYTVIPTARATQLTMNREGIRRLAAETLGIKTSPFRFAETYDEFVQASDEIGFPFVIKPIMSSSGKGQSVVREPEDIQKAWDYALEGGRAGKGKVIVEGFINFDYEITLLTIRHKDGDEIKTSFCEPIGHIQIDGDYRESWQPHPMSKTALEESRHIAKVVTSELGGLGIFGVELFVKGENVYFSEVSPRPHDTGLVTLASQELSEFALHARAILGLPIPEIKFFGPSASAVILVEGNSDSPSFENLEKVLEEPGTQLRLFGKPDLAGKRRMGVVCARAGSIEEARIKAKNGASKIKVKL
ncbi:MAG: formate-dependent phosphoribosylglycinamide formyltransferase [Leptospirales bacterium]